MRSATMGTCFMEMVVIAVPKDAGKKKGGVVCQVLLWKTVLSQISADLAMVMASETATRIVMMAT
jgi:hypothetical protein